MAEGKSNDGNGSNRQAWLISTEPGMMMMMMMSKRVGGYLVFGSYDKGYIAILI